MESSLLRYTKWLVMLLATLTGIVVAAISLMSGSVEVRHIIIFAVTIVAVMLGITVGYHRYVTHGAFEFTRLGTYLAKPWLLLCGCISWQGPPLWWAAVHWQHHQAADAPHDPHTPCRTGSWWLRLWQFWWAHLLWIPSAVPDVAKFCRLRRPDWIERVLNQWYVWVGPGLGVALSYLIGGGLGCAWYLGAIFISLHFTWAINSVTHLWGSRRYDTPDHSTNIWLLALLTGGEGLHNNHHASPKSARFARTVGEHCTDLGWALIVVLRALRCVKRVNVAHS